MKDLKDSTFTVLQCDRFHVVGVLAGGPRVRSSDKGAVAPVGALRWTLTSPLGVRARGESVDLASVFGGQVTIHPGDFPVMETTVEPGTRLHAAVLKAHAAIQQKESAQTAGIHLLDG